MTKDQALHEVRLRFMREYIPAVTRVWWAWRQDREAGGGWGRMSMRERDETLAWYRDRLERLQRLGYR